MENLSTRSFLALAYIAILLCSSHAVAQSSSDWKPNLGDQFICTIAHSSACGDFRCDGLDTIMFEIRDTAYKTTGKDETVVLAMTKPVAIHFTTYEWGPGPYYVGHPEFPTYPDTAMISITGNQAATTFNGYGSSYGTVWNNYPLLRDTSIFFQGSMLSARANGNTMFVSQLGWFFSLSGYDGRTGCAAYCAKVDWHLSLIAAILSHSSVSERPNANTSVSASRGVLSLSGTSCNRVQLIDMLGRRFRAWEFDRVEGTREISLNVNDVPSGIYFLRMQADGIDEVKRVTLAR